MIEDSKGHKIQVVLNDEALDEINKTRNAREIRAILAIQRHYCIRAVDLATETSIAYRDLDTLLYSHKSLVAKYVDESREVYYAIAPNFYAGLPCTDCKHRKKKSGMVSCKWSGDCQYNHIRMAKYLVKQMKKSLGLKKSRMVSKSKKTNKKDFGKPQGLSYMWDIDSFVDYLKYLYQAYDHLVTMPKSKIRKAIVALKRAFDIEFEGEWEQPLKMYLDHTFEMAGENNIIPSLKIMCDKNKLQSWIDSSSKWKAQLCNKHEIYCPYWKVDYCALESDKCTKGLRKKVRKTYN